MMATDLSPTQAAEVATSAYAMRLSQDLGVAEDAAPSVSGVFDISGGIHLSGLTGVGLPLRSGFGYMAWGRGNRQGECLVTVRGTYMPSINDWLTNLRMGGITGPSGYLVHAGFWRGAQSVLPQIMEHLRNRDPQILHIVGHSLGGAMATLLADALGGAGRNVRLYTFGAPRCGVEAHADYLTAKLGASNIFRVYHDTDPVPMLPVFPYSHVPHDSNAYRLKGVGKLVSIDAHLMPGYRKSVKDCAWSSLPVIQPGHSSFEAANEWLGQAAKDSGPCIMGSAYALQLILSALDWILKQLGKILASTLFLGGTLLDCLARLLYSGVLQSVRIAEAVRNMLGAALRFLGRVVAKGVNLTEAFIQFVLEMLFRFVVVMARRAVDLL